MTTSTQPIENKDVLEYLTHNQDFFVENSDILGKLHIPTDTAAGTASFHDFQIKQLKSKVEKLELTNKRLTQVAIHNTNSQKQINDFSLQLLNCKTLEQLEQTLHTQLKNTFELDSITLSLDSDMDGIQKTVTLRSTANTCLQENNGVCIRSEAIIQLTTPDAGVVGHLILGSADVQRFHEGQGDDLLVYLGGIIGYCLDKLTA